MTTTKEALSPYRAKRDFSITSEPAHDGEPGKGALSYVIQKHWASHLHYDFRLELDGTMKSWAVPKGPSFDPSIKRMAIHVEDHPLSYASFEGRIPAKQYGAGKVIIWDAGIWHPTGDPRKGLSEGNLKFVLDGHKLRGRWVLVRMNGKGEKQAPWLLIKEKDEFVRASADFSVVDEMPDSVKDSPRRTASLRKTKKRLAIGLPAEAVVAQLPATLAPQLATLAAGPPPDAQAWSYEIKFDGYRLLTRIEGAEIGLFTRNGNDWTSRLLPLRQAVAKMKLPAGWYDGEMVVPNEHGVPDFGALQRAFDAQQTQDIVLYLFDLPYCDGHDLRAVALESRRAMLHGLLKKASSGPVRFSEVFDSLPESVLASACKLGLEGVVAKRRDSAYVSRRSADWIKLKCSQRQEFVIGGFTDPQGVRTGFGALLLGVHDDKGALHYAGKVGTGFDERSLASLKAQLDTLSAATNPFAKSSAIEARAHWVKPTLVAEVSFGEWTRDGHIRHAVFRGLRSDKRARLIARETAMAVNKLARSSGAGKDHALASLRITHPERVIDASSGVTKLELLRYYGLVGELMMEHLKQRPVSLLRAPDGVSGQLFFQKHAEVEKLPGIRQLDPSLDSSHPAMLEVAAKQGLLSAAQWNVIEFHTLNTGTTSFAHPDRMVFDLDPGEGVAWAQVQEAAHLVHAFLTQLGLKAFLKTSGGKGLHLVVPLRKLYDWDSVKGFSRAIVSHLARSIPQRFVARSGPKNRVGKIFIDYLRNGLGASTVCAWSARARPGLGISVPVDWSELPMLRGGDHWTLRTAHTRLDQGNAPWKGYRKAAQSLRTAIRTLDYKPRTSS